MISKAEEEQKVLEEMIADLEEQIEDPLESKANTEHAKGLLQAAQLRLRTLIDRKAAPGNTPKLGANESYALDSEGREYIVNELTGIAEPDLMSENAGVEPGQAAKLVSWERELYLKEVEFAAGLYVKQVEVFDWWTSIRKDTKDVQQAIDLLHSKIVDEANLRTATRQLPPKLDGVPWEEAGAEAYQDVLVIAASLDVDAMTVGNLWTEVALAQGAGTYTRFAIYALRLALERHYALREFNNLSSKAQLACSRITRVHADMKAGSNKPAAAAGGRRKGRK